ncbi:MAG: hypothetical protein JWN37_358 [Candidatus Nomurabacteria bacterium]|nr:hypothetical protein [Candidatus Nomurabacteria bacterium]
MQKTIKNIVWICLGIIPFIALFVTSGGPFDFLSGSNSGLFFPFISGKNFLFRILVEIAFAGWVVLALKDTKYRINLKKSPLTICYGIFILVILIADLFGVDSTKSLWSNYERMEGFVGHIHLFAYFVVLVGMLHTLVDWKRMWKVFITSDILIILYAFFQWLGAPGLFVANHFPSLAKWASDHFAIHQSATRLDSTIGNSAYFAIFCLMFVGILALEWSKSDNPRKAWGYPVLILLNLLGIVFSGTRGTMIGFLVALLATVATMVFRMADSKIEIIALYIVTILYSIYGALALVFDVGFLNYFYPVSAIAGLVFIIACGSVFIKTNNTYRKVGLGVIILMIAALFLFQSIRNTSFIQSSPTLARIASISPTDITASSRLAIWQISLSAWKERPILGYGQDNFGYIYARKFIPEKMWNIEPWYDRSHNVFFDWLVAGGILGLLAYLSLYVSALFLLWKKGGHIPLKEKAILTGVIAGYFVHNIFVFDNLTSYILFIALLGYIVTRTRDSNETAGGKTISQDQINLLWGPVVLIVLIASLYYVNYRPLKVNKLMIKGLDINTLIQQMPFGQAVNTSQNAFTQALAMNTLGTEETREQFMQMGIQLAQIQIPSNVAEADREAAVTAISSFEAAVQKDIQTSYPDFKDNVRMLSIYGMFFNGIGDPISGEKVLTEAHTLAPKKQLISFDLIRAYIMEGKFPQAYALARETYDYAPAYKEAERWLLISSAYAKSYKEARTVVEKNGAQVELDPDVLNALVSTNQLPLALELLSELKKNHPESAKEIDAYIKQLLATKKK